METINPVTKREQVRRILWFRRDLRAQDNPLLALSGEVLPLFIFDTCILSKLSKDDKRVTFIFQALATLKKDLKERGLDLAIFYGKPSEVFEWILQRYQFDEVSASGDYDSYAKERDREISHLLPFNYLQDTYIFNPKEILKNDGTPYQVFTPFYKNVKTIFTTQHMRKIYPTKQKLIKFEYSYLHEAKNSSFAMMNISLDSIGFTEQALPPHQLLSPRQKLEMFETKIANYANDRDYVFKDSTSDLSIDLRFGTISIREVLRWLTVQKKKGVDTEPFFRQLVFRDFYAMLLYHFPYLENRNFRYRFNGIENEDYFKSFCTAQTGVPIVDAGIRQLLQSGEMHNRVRMLVASFLTKDLLLPWQWGEAFFAEHLMDYDASSNILSWQWSAGTGVDPQPYFRIFNPYTQSHKFDKDGLYVKKYIPELASTPAKFFGDEEKLIDNPYSGYSKPIVSHKVSSKKALSYFKTLVST